MTTVVAALLLGCAGWLCWPAVGLVRRERAARPVPEESALVRHRIVVSACAGLVGVTFFPTPLGWLVGLIVAAVVWSTVGRMESPAHRRDREAVARELPQVVQLIGLVLVAGGSMTEAVRQVVRALPGPGTAALRRAEARLGVGMAPVDVWRELAGQPGYERVGRALVRAETTGAPVADIVRRLGSDLAREARARTEDRARTVGVRAAVPLGLCLLPAFLVVGIVPVVASAVSSFRW